MLDVYMTRLLALVVCLIAIGLGLIFNFVGPLVFFALLAIAGVGVWLWRKRNTH